MANVLKNTAATELIAKMYLNERLADVHFVFKVNDEIEKVPANKNVLAALSPVFDTMFFGSLPENGDVPIPDADAGAFKEFLQLFYLGEMTLTMKNIETVVRLADKYDVLEHVNAFAVFLKGQLTLDNMCWGYQLAVNLQNEELVEFCEDKIARSPKKIFATDAFQRCDKSILKRIIELDLICKEIDIFDACLTWAKYACEQDDLDATKAENLRTQLGDCLKSIRFNAMKIENFSTFVMLNDGLFTPDEFKDIVLTLTAKGYEPKIFKPNPRRFKRNENEVLLCQRQAVNTPTNHLTGSEVAWFTSNQTVLLGEMCSAPTFNMHYIDQQNDAVNVTIAEINSEFPKKVLYEGSSKTWDLNRLKVSLLQPIMIKPHVMYEIRFAVLMGVGKSYYYGTWKPTVEVEDGLTFQFHRCPSHTSYDTSTSGWIQSLGVNRL
ncbi:BTB/POZ domain-containing protein 3-like [Sitodiplosis mosellana]|uniref:BTB/POZ domain-containing protein 3-like n=1 Tax=Sitodiplosis mosellana TaxID=263140 RepID=UPI002443B1D4|nr:BTB/POZ domain-containing protein 3-like [Sitodiplosis mosellana]